LYNLSDIRDHDELLEFFSRKDTSKYHLALEPALEAIRDNAAWVSVRRMSFLQTGNKLTADM
jgi:hypothetical protein